VLADAHVHYPMRVVNDLTPATAVEQMRTARRRPRVRDKLRALIVRVLSRFMSDRDWWSGYRVTVRSLRDGDVGLAFSALYRPFEEMDLSRPYASPPASGYFAQLVQDLEAVEAEVDGHDDAVIRMAHDRAELDAAVDAGATAVVHCVEGAFHLGDREDEIAANVAELARRGVAYITLAHLFYRQVATNAPALPFMPDAVYRRVFPQPRGEGLTGRGIAAVRAMVEHRVLIDLSHMDEDAFDETIRLLDEELDRDAQVPVVNSHAGYRFGDQHYMMSERQVREIARRDGVIGLIMAQHQLCDGLRDHTSTFEESVDVIRRHVDRIREITGSHRHVALGTDFDGFIKPTMAGLESAADLRRLEERLRELYGDDDAEAICCGNALRVLRKVWT
jgi:microsomal dipeptidase-like Zn-dependent dipeptidase